MLESSKQPVQSMNVGGELWLGVGEVAFLGTARIALLEQIAARGSITQAAKGAGMSYKAAWDAVDAMNNLAPAPVVETATGGRGGGGARLTDEGRRLIDAYRAVAAEYRRFLDGLNAALGDPQASLEVLRRLALRTSARNQFIGRIVAVMARTVDAEVELAIQGDRRIVAGLTNESVEQLGLRPGRRVWALVKAVAVSVQREPGKATQGPAHTNRLCGTAQRIVRGDGPVEVSVALGAGVTVRGVTATDELDALGISEGGPACAVFPASSVIVGVDD